MNQGAFSVVVKGDLVLLVRSFTNPEFMNHWSFPGGVVEPGESLKQGAVRETIEETGIVCRPEEILSVVDNTASNIRVTIFKAAYLAGEITIDPIEIAEARWVNLKDAVALPLAFNSEDVLRHLARQLSELA